MTRRPFLAPTLRLRPWILLVASLLALTLPRPASAATITVNTFAQGSVAGCSFAEAIASINAGADTGGCVAVVVPDAYGTNDTIILPFGTYNFTVADNDANALPVITESLTINGNGSTLARSGAQAFRFFEVTEGNLTLNSLTLTGGNPGAATSGGAVLDHSPGTLTVTGSTFSGNTAQEGGAISKPGTGNVTVTGSTFRNNTATSGTSDAEGGAILIGSDNIGGGGNLTVTGSTFVSNTATSSGIIGDASGGAIKMAGDIGGANNLTVTGSTFRNNTATSSGADADGGAIEADENNDLTITGSIFTNNTATSSGAGASRGGALLSDISGTSAINNNCFVGNTAQSGGGVFSDASTNAENNWWGDSSGPSEAGPGTGDAVSSNVDFDPFLTSPPFAGCGFLAIPTLSEWAQLGMIALLIVGGLLALRRRARPT